MRYRQPRAFNLVTFLLLAAAGLVAYGLVYMWPVYSAYSRARSILLDQIPTLYQANLRPDEVAQTMIEQIKERINAELDRAGINSAAAKIFVYRNPKKIGLEVRFKTKIRFPLPDRTYEIQVSPKVVSDATRIDW